MIRHTAPLLSPAGLEAVCRWGYALIFVALAGLVHCRLRPSLGNSERTASRGQQ